MKAQFISDLHLCEERPETTRAFLAFLDGPARRTDALYILGDLFEYWAGDDDDSPLIDTVSVALSRLSSVDTRLFFLAGNRDFLIGPGFAERVGLRLLDEPSLIELDGTRALLSHGDTLCTDDQAYQTYRGQVRDPAWIREFLDRPLADRKHFIENIRQHSERAKRVKQAEIMDVNAGAVEALLRAYDYPLLIHGHTHRPARHLHRVDGHDCDRWVLSDWQDEAHYLAWEDGTLSARCLRPGSASDR
ncbi:UDP-2,3-diacylglucosamine diphosphatase [Rhodocyclaceae bacterium SMB388]